MKLKKGLFEDDERSKKVKTYATSRAFYYSLYIWIGLLAFQKYFDKDDLLIVGLLGMMASLYISLFLSRNKKGLE
jgi:hypothetical protein